VIWEKASGTTFVRFFAVNPTGVLDNSTLGLKPSKGKDVGHAVLLVRQTAEHWTIKNSWGTNWADCGEFRISKATKFGWSCFLDIFPPPRRAAVPRDVYGVCELQNDEAVQAIIDKELDGCTIYFSMKSCGPCKQFKPLYVAYAELHPHCFMTDESKTPGLCDEWQIECFPSLLQYIDGEWHLKEGSDAVASLA